MRIWGACCVVTLRVVALMLVLVAALVFAPLAGAAFPGTNGSIVFTVPEGAPSVSPHIESLYLGPEGSGVPDKANLPATEVDRGGDAFDPSWSPDGRSLAFVSRRSGHRQIYVAQLNFARELVPSCGSEVCRLTNNSAEDYDPSWSPDGQQILFTSTRDGSPQIYRMNAAGGEVTRLTFDNAIDQQATWSQAGMIAFASDRNGTSEIYVMNASGGEVRSVTNQPQLTTDPTWSPDGSEIAYANGKVGSFQVFAIKLSGGPPRQLTKSMPDNKLPAWSPDGTKILITQGPALAGPTDLAVIDAKTGRIVSTYLDNGEDGNWAPLPEPPSDNTSLLAPGSGVIARPLGGAVSVNPGHPEAPAAGAGPGMLASQITRPVELPANATYDTTQGAVDLAVASGGAAAPQVSSVEITGGRFAFVQPRPLAVPTVRLLGSARGCSGGRHATVARPNRESEPYVRGHSKGRMQTAGDAGRAASKGTRWEVRNTCRGTIYRVFEDALIVTDPRRKRPIRVTAGHHYLVRFGAR